MDARGRSGLAGDVRRPTSRSLVLPLRPGLYGEHLVFATHYVAFVVIAFPLLMFLLGLPPAVLTGIGDDSFSQDYDNVAATIFTLSFIAYLFFGLRRFYRVHWLYALVIAAIVGGGFFMILQYYRMLLFHWVLWGMH